MWRSLSSKPGYAVVAIASLALGIGATSAIYSFVDAVLLSPLPYPASERMAVIQEMVQGRNANGGPERFYEWLDAKTIEAGCAMYGENFTMLSGEIPQRVPGIRTFGNLLGTFGAAPARGRDFTVEEQRGGGARVAILTHSAWQTRFGGSADIVGRKIVLGGTPHEVVGVMPPGFAIEDAEILTPEPEQRMPRSARFLMQLARIKAGVPMAQAAAELEVMATGMRRQHPDTDANLGVTLLSYREQVARDARLPLLILLGAVGCVLLLACLNVASLSLHRVLGRGRELAVRQALGASRRRLLLLLLGESALLTGIGGLFGLLLAAWGIDLLKLVMPADLPRLNEVQLDGRVVLFGLLLTGLATLLAGTWPALRGASVDSSQTLKSGGRGLTHRFRGQGLLVMTEAAVALLLLVGAGLLFRSLWNLERRPLGFAPQQLLSFRVSLPWQTEPRQLHAFYQRVLQEVAKVSGVREGALTDRMPLGGGTQSGELAIAGRPLQSIPAAVETGKRAVSWNYHSVIGARLLNGRFLEERDRTAKRTVINQSAARTFFAGTNPLGQRITLRSKKNQPKPEDFFEIVGVVADLPVKANETQTMPTYYIPYEQDYWPLATFLVRSHGDASVLADAIRQQVAQIDNRQVVEQMETVEKYLYKRNGDSRVQAVLMSVFAGTALLLAAIGIYGLLANTMADRRREISIRMALGAAPRHVLEELLRRCALPLIVGLAVGVLNALAVTRVLETLLYGLSATDPATYGLAIGVLVTVALLAGWLPARRAMTAEPVRWLQSE